MKGRSMQVVLGLFLAIVIPLYAQTAPAGQQTPEDSAGANRAAGDAEAGNKAHDDSFIIGKEDQLSISVWKEPDLTKSIPVRSDGKISMPLIGELQAAGRTPLQLEHDIADKLQSFITAPEVTVIVEKVNSKKFNILGEVTKPGSYSLAQASTIVDAIALAGGFRDFAKKTGVYLLRKSGDGRETKLLFNYKDFIKGKNPGQNVQIEPNDTIIVP